MKRLTLRTFMARHKDDDIKTVEAGPHWRGSVVLEWHKPRSNVWTEVRVAIPEWLIHLRCATHREGIAAKATEIRDVLGIQAQ